MAKCQWLGLALRLDRTGLVWQRSVAGTSSQTGQDWTGMAKCQWPGLALRLDRTGLVWQRSVAGTSSQTGQDWTGVAKVSGWD